MTYYYVSLSLEAKASNLALFTSRSRPILAATSAIRARFDFENVRLIVFFQGCWSLTDFVQGCGRATRAIGSRGYIEVVLKPNRELLSDYISRDIS